jgi:Holliday junction resolvase RusA-like endonuclease
MNRTLHALVRFKPVGEARPRVVTRGNRTFAYTPKSKERKQFQQLLRAQVKEAPLEGAIVVQINFSFTPLKSWSDKKKELMNGKYKTTKPDLDNLLKFVLDAGNGILWKDDKQIVKFDNCTKCYGSEDRVLISAIEVDE